jgi:hypothetical protein
MKRAYRIPKAVEGSEAGISTVIASVSKCFVIIVRGEIPMTKGTRNIGKPWARKTYNFGS